MPKRPALLPTPRTLEGSLPWLDDSFKRIVDRMGVPIEAGDLSASLLTLLMPTGVILPYGVNSAPTGFLLCDGASLLRADYAALFGVIGTTYGAADGTHFNVPNLKGRAPVGIDAAQTEFDVMGELGGVKVHTLIAAEIPIHTHIQNSHNHTQDPHTHIQDAHGHLVDYVGLEGGVSSHNHDTSGNALSAAISDIGGRTGGTTTGAVAKSLTPTNQNTTPTNQSATPTNQNAGGDGAHQNLQPYIVLAFIIKT